MAKNQVVVTLEKSGHGQESVSALSKATDVLIVDVVSHASAKELYKGIKSLIRTIDDHYDKVKRPFIDGGRAVEVMRKADKDPLVRAADIIEGKDLRWTNEQRRIEQDAADQRRREAEDLARTNREAALAAAEVDAQRLEEASDDLSDRERIFCDAIVDGLSPTKAADLADYSDPLKQGQRLMASIKIKASIVALQHAKAIRQQAAEQARKPLVVESTPQPETQVATVAGTALKSYYGCDAVFDIARLKQAWIDGVVPADTFTPNLVHLNAAARQLKEMFPLVYHGCTLKKTQGIAG